MIQLRKRMGWKRNRYCNQRKRTSFPPHQLSNLCAACKPEVHEREFWKAVDLYFSMVGDAKKGKVRKLQGDFSKK